MAESVKEEVLAVADASMERYNEADFHGVLEYFTEDCMFFPPDSDPVVGKKDSLALITSFHASGDSQHEEFVDGPRELQFESLGDAAAHVVRFVNGRRTAGGEICVYAKKWMLFKKVNGKWLIHRMAFSPRTKPAQPKSDE